MANLEHLKILGKGVEIWNKWRFENDEIRPDLSGADLSGINLSDDSDSQESGSNLGRQSNLQKAED